MFAYPVCHAHKRLLMIGRSFDKLKQILVGIDLIECLATLNSQQKGDQQQIETSECELVWLIEAIDNRGYFTLGHFKETIEVSDVVGQPLKARTNERCSYKRPLVKPVPVLSNGKVVFAFQNGADNLKSELSQSFLFY